MPRRRLRGLGHRARAGRLQELRRSCEKGCAELPPVWRGRRAGEPHAVCWLWLVCGAVPERDSEASRMEYPACCAGRGEKVMDFEGGVAQGGSRHGEEPSVPYRGGAWRDRPDDGGGNTTGVLLPEAARGLGPQTQCRRVACAGPSGLVGSLPGRIHSSRVLLWGGQGEGLGGVGPVAW